MLTKIRPLASVLSIIVILYSVLYGQSVSANHQHQPDRGHRGQGHDSRYLWDRNFSFYLDAAVAFGGDEIGRFVDSSGDVEKVTAGGGVGLSAGLLLPLDPWLGVRFSGGYQNGSVSRLNGETSFERFKFGVSMLRSHRSHEFGAGLALHTGISYDCDFSSVCAGDVDFEAAVGYVFEYAVVLRGPSFRSKNMAYGSRRHGGQGRNWANARHQGLRLGVRYTGIEYEPKLIGGEVLDGTSIAAFIGLVF